MKIIGLTGGIGSGKSTVANFFHDLGIAIYIADDEAKKLMHQAQVKQKLIQLLGKQAFKNKKLNRKYISLKVFNDKNLLADLNAIVHPAVAQHFSEWLQQQKGCYVIKEAAILFENGGYKNCDKTILVKADKETRFNRVLNRDQTTLKEIEARMKNQWPDSEKEKLADFIIQNNEGIPELKSYVQIIHEKLIKMCS